jgi:integrase
MGRDSLHEGIARARLSGAPGTVHQTQSRAGRFVEELREMGYSVQRWENLNNRHVADWAARALQSKDEGGFGHQVSTVKDYLSAVRAVCNAWGNERIYARNDQFRTDPADPSTRIIPQREYVTNEDRSVPEQVYQAVRDNLAAGGLDQRRLAVEIDLMRHLGLRHEEARKFNPDRAVLQSGDVHVSDGTKGGRERTIAADQISDQARAAIDAAREYVTDRGSLIPSGMTERQWETKSYDLAQGAGLSKEECGASFHGLRHGYAQDRYEVLTGWPCPAKGGTIEQAHAVGGDNWREIDRDARLLLKTEMGHGPDRDSVISVYIGSWR